MPKPKIGSEDELAFLRSVTTTVAAQKAPPPAPPAPPRKVEKPVEKPKEEAPVTIDAAPGLIRLPGAEETPATAKPKPQTAAAGIKCAECGTQNRPTEWYCEKCGAELSSF